jgi:osmoprotectant transport system ATP-binding protein
LSSPSGQGVAVDGDGRAVGAVDADEVLAALATARRDLAA